MNRGPETRCDWPLVKRQGRAKLLFGQWKESGGRIFERTDFCRIRRSPGSNLLSGFFKGGVTRSQPISGQLPGTEPNSVSAVIGRILQFVTGQIGNVRPLRPSLWRYARKSISDWKNIFLPECEQCGVLEKCGGLFQSAERMHSSHIHALPQQIA